MIESKDGEISFTAPIFSIIVNKRTKCQIPKVSTRELTSKKEDNARERERSKDKDEDEDGGNQKGVRASKRSSSIKYTRA